MKGGRQAQNHRDLGASVLARQGYVDVAKVNDHIFKIAVNTDPFPWHHHPNSDELFIVVEGASTVEFEDSQAVQLRPDDSLLVPQGVIHRTIPHGRTVNLLVERGDIETVMIGDASPSPS